MFAEFRGGAVRLPLNTPLVSSWICLERVILVASLVKGTSGLTFEYSNQSNNDWWIIFHESLRSLSQGRGMIASRSAFMDYL